MEIIKPMELLVERCDFGDDYTEGRFYVDGMLFGESMEPKSRHLSSDMPLDKIKALKVYGATAIPTGRYEVIWTYSPRLHDRAYAKKYGGKFPCLLYVPAWSGVLIHPFNKGPESKGCISIAEKYRPGYVVNATKGYQDFMDFYFVPAMERGQKVFITITEK